jgi:alkaline phosphatase D
MAELNRRQTLTLLAIAAGTTGACATNAEQVEVAPAPTPNPIFKHGVASGDPMTDSVVLWTRVTIAAASEQIAWVIATDPDLTQIVAKGEAVARAEADHTVKVIPTGLAPGETYYYQFSVGEAVSPIGRTKTLPEGALDRLGIALVSCSNYAFGYFNAYAAIAEDEQIDVVLHTGDYIYEYGIDGWGNETASALGRPHDPPHEIVTLNDYRRRHAQYKSDAGSIAMHAAHPFVACWDDHESTNNPWQGGAQNHQPETEGDWDVRRDASLQAYYEWMPIREPEAGRTRADFWRTYSFGDLATLITLETRHTARGEQVDYLQHADTIQDQASRDAFMQSIINDPSRKMLSEPMEASLRSGLQDSIGQDQPWRLIGNASPIARMLTPDVVGLGVIPEQKLEDGASFGKFALAWKGKWNLPFYTDTWDGYPAARERFYDLCRDVGAQDILVLTGDSHSFWANELADDADQPMGLEIGTAGVSSPGDFVETGWGDAISEKLDRTFESELDEVRWTDNLHQGFVRIILERQSAKVDFIAVNTVLAVDSRTRTIRSETITRKGDRIQFLNQ